MTVRKVGIDLCCVQLCMTKDILENTHIHSAALIHQGRRRVTELMDRKPSLFKPCLSEIFIDDVLDGFIADSGIAVAEKERVGIGGERRERTADHKILRKGGTAGVVQINDALLGAFTEHAQGSQLAVDVRKADADKLRKTHTAIEKEGDDSKISRTVARILIVKNALEQGNAFLLAQIFRQMLVFFGGFDVFCGIKIGIAAIKRGNITKEGFKDEIRT